MLKGAERKAEMESIAKIEAYKKIEKHVYRRIERERAADVDKTCDHSHLQDELDQNIRDLQSDLLEIEMKLQDALLIARKSFFSRINQIIEDMKQLNQEYIQNVLNEV